MPIKIRKLSTAVASAIVLACTLCTYPGSTATPPVARSVASLVSGMAGSAVPAAVYRYHAGTASQPDSRGHIWLSDQRLTSAGHLARPARLAGMRVQGVYTQYRHAFASYQVTVAQAGTYAVSLGLVRCTQGGRCVVFHRSVRVRSKAKVLTIANPMLGQRGGVSTILIRATTVCATASVALVSGCGSSSTVGEITTPQPTATPTVEAAIVGIPAGGVFGPNSVWHDDVQFAPVAANSSAQVARLAQAARAYYGGHPAFNVYKYGVSWVTVGRDQPRVRVQFSNCQNKAKTPAGLFGSGGQFEDVPIPDTAWPTAGTDAAVTVYQPSTDTLWDFWKANHDSTGWHACWGGRIDHVSQNPGAFPAPFGTSASGLAYEGGAVTVQDVQAGVIDHAVSLSLPPELISRVTSWPATRTDGASTAPDSLSEGSRLRLAADVNVDRLGLTPIATMVAKAAQKYGFIVTDRAGCVGVVAESPAARQQIDGINPWVPLLAGKAPYQVLDGFPWDRLQALPVDYGKR